jgi:hypothetical protein
MSVPTGAALSDFNDNPILGWPETKQVLDVLMVKKGKRKKVKKGRKQLRTENSKLLIQQFRVVIRVTSYVEKSLRIRLPDGFEFRCRRHKKYRF